MTTLTGYKRDTESLYIDKDPASILQYTMDWTNWLASGESIVNSASISTGLAPDSTTSTDTYETKVTVEQLAGDDTDTKLRVDAYAKSSNSKMVNMTLSHGTEGKIYKVFVQIVTDEGEVCEKFFKVVCKKRSF